MTPKHARRHGEQDKERVDEGAELRNEDEIDQHHREDAGR